MRNSWLAEGLSELGLSAGDVVLVHTSMKGLGYIDGGPAAVIDTLMQVVGEEGTVLFPTLTGSETNGPQHPPAIDVKSTPCAAFVGIVPETARRRVDATRSIHPTHSITALGQHAMEWTAAHEHGHSPCDESSPYYRLMDRGGKILLLGGVDHNSNTSLHCIEEIANVPYHLQDDVTECIVRIDTGEEVIVSNCLHRWQNRYSHLNLLREFNNVIAPLVEAGAQRTVHIGKSNSTLIDASKMRDVLLPILKTDPLFLLNRT